MRASLTLVLGLSCAIAVACSDSEGDGNASGAAGTGNVEAGAAGRDSSAGRAGSSGGSVTAGTGGQAGRAGSSGAGRAGASGSGGRGVAGSDGAEGGDGVVGGNGAAGGAAGAAPSDAGGGAGGSGNSGGLACKRGIASNTPPGAAFSGKIAWWYNWAIRGSGAGQGIEFVPMVWGEASVADEPPDAARFLLGFNEPNFFAQADLSAERAAELWPELEAKAAALDIPLASPGMNFCGPANECHGTNPYQYLKDFFAACDGCKVDYVAVHWYNCDLPSLRDYLEPDGGLEGFEQFERPLWITEFSCDGSASVAEQEAYMREAIPYLEGNPHVFRYSWFSAGPIPNAELMDDAGEPTALGSVYMSLPGSCD